MADRGLADEEATIVSAFPSSKDQRLEMADRGLADEEAMIVSAFPLD